MKVQIIRTFLGGWLEEIILRQFCGAVQSLVFRASSHSGCGVMNNGRLENSVCGVCLGVCCGR